MVVIPDLTSSSDWVLAIEQAKSSAGDKCKEAADTLMTWYKPRGGK